MSNTTFFVIWIAFLYLASWMEVKRQDMMNTSRFSWSAVNLLFGVCAAVFMAGHLIGAVLSTTQATP